MGARSSKESKPRKDAPPLITAVDEMQVPKYVYLDMEVQEGTSWRPLGRIEIILFSNTPKTSKNFGAICNGFKKSITSRSSGCSIDVLTYKNTYCHRVIPGFMLQCGDITDAIVGQRGQRPGTGGGTIYEGDRFPDENFINKFGKLGLLAQANAGPNTNGSQVFLCTSACAHLQGKHVVFGGVRNQESYDIVRTIESYGSRDGTPSKIVKIADCGVIEYYTEEEITSCQINQPQTIDTFN